MSELAAQRATPTPGHVVVRMLRHYQKWNQGEVCGFPEAEAKLLAKQDAVQIIGPAGSKEAHAAADAYAGLTVEQQLEIVDDLVKEHG